MGFSKLKCLFYSLLILVGLVVLLISYLCIPILLIPYTSTAKQSLQTMIAFDQQLTRLEIELNKCAKSVHDFEEFVQKKMVGVEADLKNSTEYIRNFIQDYNPKFEENLTTFMESLTRLQNHYSESTKVLGNYTPVNSVVRKQIFFSTNDFTMWGMDCHMLYLEEQGIILSLTEFPPGYRRASINSKKSLEVVEKLVVLLDTEEHIKKKYSSLVFPPVKNLSEVLLWHENTLTPIMKEVQNIRKQIKTILKSNTLDLGTFYMQIENKKDKLIKNLNDLSDQELKIFRNYKKWTVDHSQQLNEYSQSVDKLKLNIHIRKSTNLDEDEENEL